MSTFNTGTKGGRLQKLIPAPTQAIGAVFILVAMAGAAPSASSQTPSQLSDWTFEERVPRIAPCEEPMSDPLGLSESGEGEEVMTLPRVDVTVCPPTDAPGWIEVRILEPLTGQRAGEHDEGISRCEAEGHCLVFFSGEPLWEQMTQEDLEASDPYPPIRLWSFATSVTSAFQIGLVSDDVAQEDWVQVGLGVPWRVEYGNAGGRGWSLRLQSAAEVWPVAIEHRTAAGSIQVIEIPPPDDQWWERERLRRTPAVSNAVPPDSAPPPDSRPGGGGR